MSLKSSSSKLCLVSGLFVAAIVIVSSPSVSPSLAEACGCEHGHHSGREEEPEATCHHHHHDHDHHNERRGMVTSYSPLESVGLNVHNTLIGENKRRAEINGGKEEDYVVSSETEKVDDGAEDGVPEEAEEEEEHQGGCPFDHHEGHHHHHEGGHDEDDHHHHHEHHHHDHDHDHHDHEHHPSSPSSSVNDYDWVATVRDKESGAVKHKVPILLTHKESGIARFTPLTFEHYMMKGVSIEKQQQAQQDASFVDSRIRSLMRDGADGDAAEKRKEQGKGSSSSSSTALASLIFYYTTPCRGLCEDSYKLYVAAASAVNKAMAESLATNVGNLKEKEENSSPSFSPSVVSSPSPSDKASSQSSSSSATATTAASFIARAKKFIESKLLTAQFYIPKASKAQEDAYYRHSQHEEEAAPPDAASSSLSPLPKGAFVPASPSYYSVVARHGVRGSVITNDFPLITIEISSSPKSKSVAHVAEGNEGIIGFTGSLTPWSLWFDGVRPVLYAEHKPYCDGLSEIKALLVRAASKGTTAPPTTTPTVTNEGEESQQTPTTFSNSNKGTKGSFTPQDVSTVLSSVPDHDLWMAFCDLLAEGPEETVSNRDVTATTDSSFLTNPATYTSATASTDASSDITNPSAGGATSSEETMMSRSVGQIFKSRLTASTRNCGPQCEEEEKQRKGDADVEKDSPATHQDVANGVDHSHFEGMDDMVANVHATVDEAEAVRVINITDYVFENGLLA